MKSVEKNKYKQKRAVIKGKSIVYTEKRYDKYEAYPDTELVGEGYESEVTILNE
jgi:hypothetical protein